jgi:hypothetical protein
MFYGKAIGKYRQFSRVVGWALEATGAAEHGNTDQVLNNGLQTGLGSCFFNAGATGTLPENPILSCELYHGVRIRVT